MPSGCRDPEAACGGTSHHVGEGCFILMTSCFVIAARTSMGACAVGPAVAATVLNGLASVVAATISVVAVATTAVVIASGRTAVAVGGEHTS